MTTLQRFIIRWMHKGLPGREKVEIKNFAHIKKVCLMVSQTDENALDDLTRAIKIYQQHGITTDLLVYLPVKEIPDKLVASDFQVLSKQDLNIMGLVKKDALNGIQQKQYDLFLYYNPEKAIPLEHAAMSVNAMVSVGLKTEEGFETDITISPKSQGMIHFIETVNYYLKNINSVL